MYLLICDRGWILPTEPFGFLLFKLYKFHSIYSTTYNMYIPQDIGHLN